jgi:hypothetical protein
MCHGMPPCHNTVVWRDYAVRIVVLLIGHSLAMDSGLHFMESSSSRVWHLVGEQFGNRLGFIIM